MSISLTSAASTSASTLFSNQHHPDTFGQLPQAKKKDLDDDACNDEGANTNTQQLPKVWTIEDPFQFAPTAPDGDPWMFLLEPLLQKDQKQCDSWKEEVQNLLIFAGLFSAVVTTFIIESYKGLQSDPNSTSIALLYHIAARLDAPLAPNTNITASPQLPKITIPSFSPSGASIRINAFWFTSLVLSLATVLIGTISLQWLSEHQTYSDLTPREKYAIYHLRQHSLTRWHVDKVFTAMPLLLQSALVLFLLGIVDFLHMFGQKAVTIPIAVFVGITLFFLVATTVLPALHALSLYFRFHFTDDQNQAGLRELERGDYPKAPTPCPYKSPQSHAIRAVLRPAFSILDHLYPHIRNLVRGTRKLAHRTRRIFVKKRPHEQDVVEKGTKDITLVDDEDEYYGQSRNTFTQYLLYASIKNSWVKYDKDWLAIRDSFMRCVYGHDAMDESIGWREDEVSPVLDTVLGLRRQSYHKATSGAAYACFADISEETLKPLWSNDPTYKHDTKNNGFQKRLRQSAYLHDVLEGIGLVDVFRMEEVLNLSLTGVSSPEEEKKKKKTLHKILHQQNLYAFLSRHYLSDRTMLSNHRKELSLRLSTHFYTRKIQDVNTTHLISDFRFPSCLAFNPFERFLEPEAENDTFDMIAWQTANLMMSMVQMISSSSLHGQTRTRTSILLNPLVQQIGIPAFIQAACFFNGHSIILVNSSHADGTLKPFQRSIAAKFDEIVTFVSEALEQEIKSWPSEGKVSQPSLLFYVGTLYASVLLEYTCPRKTNQEIENLLQTLQKYKSRTVDEKVNNAAVEKRLALGRKNFYESMIQESGSVMPFSEMWWKNFERQARITLSAAVTTSNVRPRPLSTSTTPTIDTSESASGTTETSYC